MCCRDIFWNASVELTGAETPCYKYFCITVCAIKPYDALRCISQNESVTIRPLPSFNTCRNEGRNRRLLAKFISCSNGFKTDAYRWAFCIKTVWNACVPRLSTVGQPLEPTRAEWCLQENLSLCNIYTCIGRPRNKVFRLVLNSDIGISDDFPNCFCPKVLMKGEAVYGEILTRTEDKRWALGHFRPPVLEIMVHLHCAKKEILVYILQHNGPGVQHGIVEDNVTFRLR